MTVLRVERAGGVVTATMNRPERRNALDAELFEALRALFAEVAANDDDRVLVLTGAGGAFSSGGDLAPSTPAAGDPTPSTPAAAPSPPSAGDPTPSMPGAGGPVLPDASGADQMLAVMRRFNRTVQALFDCPKPVIAAVDGVAAGAGLSLALGCDLVVASDRARFALLFVRRGLALDCGASWLAPRRVGPGRAAELALLGDWVEAADAERIGLVNRVVPAGDLAAAAHDWATRLAGHPVAAVARIKRGLRVSAGETFAEAIEREAADQVACAGDPGFRERLQRRG